MRNWEMRWRHGRLDVSDAFIGTEDAGSSDEPEEYSASKKKRR